VRDALGADVAADLEAMTCSWSPQARQELCERAVRLASAGVPPAAALLIAIGVLADE
jgi:hypothetical protein